MTALAALFTLSPSSLRPRVRRAPTGTLTRRAWESRRKGASSGVEHALNSTIQITGLPPAAQINLYAYTPVTPLDRVDASGVRATRADSFWEELAQQRRIERLLASTERRRAAQQNYWAQRRAVCTSGRSRCPTTWVHAHCPICDGAMAARPRLDRCGTCEGRLLELLALDPRVQALEELFFDRQWRGDRLTAYILDLEAAAEQQVAAERGTAWNLTEEPIDEDGPAA